MLSLLSFLGSRLNDDFDEDFYRTHYGDVASVQDLRKHYRRYGAAEGRFRNFREALIGLQKQCGPLPGDFSPAGYRALNPDVSALFPQDWRLTLHYVQFGRAEGRLYRKPDAPRAAATEVEYDDADLTTADGVVLARRPAQDFALEVPFRHEAKPIRAASAMAAVIHARDPESVPSLLAKLANIPVAVDLFLSTDAETKGDEILKLAASWKKGAVDVRITPDRAHGVAPMLLAFSEVFERYDLFLHMQAERAAPGGPPRDRLIDDLIGSKEIARSTLSLFDDPRLGLVFPQQVFEHRGAVNWGHDYDLARGLLRRLGVALSKNFTLEFPPGGMFVARSAAIRPLLDLDLSREDFADDGGEAGGTLASAISRSLLMVVESSGHEWLKVVEAGQYPLTGAVLPVDEPADVRRHRLKVFQPLLSAANEAGGPGALAPAGSRPLSSYPSGNERPRLTLLAPDLAPSCGGLSTALTLLDRLAGALGDGWDRRIVATDRPLDGGLASVFGAYRAEPYAPTLDEARRQLVDAANREGRLNLRKADVFVGTAWWTAGFARALEADRRRAFGGDLPFVHLITEDEPSFYGAGASAALAEDSYREGGRTLAVIETEELFTEMTARYAFRAAWCLPYAMDENLAALLAPAPRERQILIHARPGVARDAFELICDGVFRWRQSDPLRASRWEIVFFGEDFPPSGLGPLRQVTVIGTPTLEAYAERLNRAAVGVSLALSPHPGPAALEMAAAGLVTITNSHGRKDLRARFPGVVSLDRLNGESLAAALEAAVASAEQTIGKAGARAQGQLPRLAARQVLDVFRLAEMLASDVDGLSRRPPPRMARRVSLKGLFDKVEA